MISKKFDVIVTRAGISIEASTKINITIFNEGLIFTHREISEPSIL